MYDPNQITYFGESDARNRRLRFGIKADDRTRHVYVIGKTGMGKSTLLENMAVQDINNGNGMAFIDPHGKTAELLLEYIPEHRIKDVMYFAPFDSDNPISFNVMEDVGPDKRHLVASGLMSTFKKIWVDAWSARMEYILNNAILALLEYPGSTLLSINKMLADKGYRDKVVENITDPSVKSYWVDEFGNYTERFAAEATPAIQNKIGQFTANPLIRNIIGQPKSSFDMRKMMDERKIVIVNLSKGQVGEQNASLLGSMLITKMYLSAMSRADVSPAVLEQLPNFYFYVDEFQSFANESFADILSEARKYKLNLTIAHQYIEQMSEEVRAAVFGNVGTMITFRVGSFDAELLEKEFAPQFTAEDLVNLGAYQIYLKLMIDGIGSRPFSAGTLPPIAKPEIDSTKEVIAASRLQFSKPRDEVETSIVQWMSEITENSKKGSKKSKPKTVREALRGGKPQVQNKKPQQKKEEGVTTHTPFKSALKDQLVNLKVVDSKPSEKAEEKKEQFSQREQEKKRMQKQVSSEKLSPKADHQTRGGSHTALSKQKTAPQITLQPQVQSGDTKSIEEKHVSKSQLSNKKKNPSKENVNQLKDALSGILKQTQEKEEKAHKKSEARPQKYTQPVQDKSKAYNQETKQQHVPQQRNDDVQQHPASQQVSGPKEVSEEELRRVLHGS